MADCCHDGLRLGCQPANWHCVEQRDSAAGAEPFVLWAQALTRVFCGLGPIEKAYNFFSLKERA